MKKNATVLALANIGRRFIGGFGTRMFSGSRSKGIGPYSESTLERHPGSTLFQIGRRTFRGNRWMPHTGTKQRARFARWPDGIMHSPTPALRTNAAKRIDNVHRMPARALVGSGPDHLAASAVQVAQNAFDNYEDVTHATSDAARQAGADLGEAFTKAADSTEAFGAAAADLALALGDQIEWTSSNTRKLGEITCVIPAGQTPGDFAINAGGGGAPRDHESYVVRARSVSAGGVQGTLKNYWPVVSLINRTA